MILQFWCQLVPWKTDFNKSGALNCCIMNQMTVRGHALNPKISAQHHCKQLKDQIQEGWRNERKMSKELLTVQKTFAKKMSVSSDVLMGLCVNLYPKSITTACDSSWIITRVYSVFSYCQKVPQPMNPKHWLVLHSNSERVFSSLFIPQMHLFSLSMCSLNVKGVVHSKPQLQRSVWRARLHKTHIYKEHQVLPYLVLRKKNYCR